MFIINDFNLTHYIRSDKSFHFIIIIGYCFYSRKYLIKYIKKINLIKQHPVY